MTTIYNAAPKAIIQGFKDSSGRAPVYDPVPIPTHLPLLPLFTERGPTNEPLLLSGDSITEIYGRETFNQRGKFYTHQHVYADTFRSRQSVMIQRLVPPDVGPKARLLLSLDIVEEDIPQYQRNPDGTFARDAMGDKIPTGATLPGYKLRWVQNDWESSPGVFENFAEMTPKAGIMTNGAGVQSVQYPILEFEASSVGEWGNRVGLRLSTPTTLSAGGTNLDLIDDIKSFLFRFQFVEKSADNSTAKVIEGLMGEQSLDLTFAADKVDRKVGNMQVSVEDVLIQAFNALSDPDRPKVYGPFGRMHLYRNNYEQICANIGAKEAPLGFMPELTMTADSEYLHLVNPFTGLHVGGEPYGTIEIQDTSSGGIYISEHTSLYAAGASDGTINDATYDAAVKNWYLDWPKFLDDWAKYPFSAFWDSGFSLETKEAMLVPVGRRHDVFVVLATQDVNEPQNTIPIDSSLAIALRSAASAYPESVIHGTPVARVAIVGQSGYLINSNYKRLLPLSLEFAARVAAFMGAGSGRWNQNRAFDVSPNNIVSMFRDVNNPFKPSTVNKRDWDNGLIWAQSYDTRSLFFPAFQTAYDDDTSVLNSFITMCAAVEAVKASYRSWRDITGRADLTRGQLVERLTAMIEADLEPSRFNNRYVIQPEVYFTQKDEQRGYSYSVNIHIFAPNMVTVGTYTIELHRRSDLEE